MVALGYVVEQAILIVFFSTSIILAAIQLRIQNKKPTSSSMLHRMYMRLLRTDVIADLAHGSTRVLWHLSLVGALLDERCLQLYDDFMSDVPLQLPTGSLE
jgi:hypothetical protein